MSRKKPKGTLSASQIKKALKLRGKKPIKEIAEELNVSVSNIKRSIPNTSFYFHNYKYVNNLDLVEKILKYYFKHGKPKTVEKFPELNVKSIIDRPEYYGFKKEYRQLRWKDKEIIESAKMAGLISFKGQWMYFKRPRAFEGSIQSMWRKKIKLSPNKVNGLSSHRGSLLVLPKCKPIKTMVEYSRKRKNQERKVYLWVDLEKHLRPDVDPSFKIAIETMANFQRWLWKCENPKPKILKMIRERETVSE